MTPSSTQYSCPAVTHSLLSPFSLLLPSVSTTSSHAQHSGFPPSCFHSTCLLTKVPHLVWHSHTFIHHISAAEWLAGSDWSIFSPLLAAPTGGLVHSSFIPLHPLHPFFSLEIIFYISSFVRRICRKHKWKPNWVWLSLTTASLPD